jgi:hypothetical protein
MTGAHREIAPDTSYFSGQQLSISCDRHLKLLPVASITSTFPQLTRLNFRCKWVMLNVFGSVVVFPRACLRRTTRPA